MSDNTQHAAAIAQTIDDLRALADLHEKGPEGLELVVADPAQEGDRLNVPADLRARIYREVVAYFEDAVQGNLRNDDPA